MKPTLTICSGLIVILGSLSTSNAVAKEGDDLYFVTIPQSHIFQPKKKHTGTVIFLHGMNFENEPGIKDLMKQVDDFQNDIAHLKVIFPRAPQAPYSAHQGELRYIWYDEELITPYRKERLETFEKAYRDLKQLVQNELDNGLRMEDIIIGGFGQGGTISMHLGYRFLQNISGVFTMGSFIHDDSILYENLKTNDYPRIPPILMMQGTNDDKALCLWAQDTFKILLELEVKGDLILFQETAHEVTKEMWVDLWSWVLRLIPDTHGPTKKKNLNI